MAVSKVSLSIEEDVLTEARERAGRRAREQLMHVLRVARGRAAPEHDRTVHASIAGRFGGGDRPVLRGGTTRPRGDHQQEAPEQHDHPGHGLHDW